MIIGICGLIGSGKDTIADYLIRKHNFQKISFADKLKDSVSVMLTGIVNCLTAKPTKVEHGGKNVMNTGVKKPEKPLLQDLYCNYLVQSVCVMAFTTVSGSV